MDPLVQESLFFIDSWDLEYNLGPPSIQWKAFPGTHSKRHDPLLIQLWQPVPIIPILLFYFVKRQSWARRYRWEAPIPHIANLNKHVLQGGQKIVLQKCHLCSHVATAQPPVWQDTSNGEKASFITTQHPHLCFHWSWWFAGHQKTLRAPVSLHIHAGSEGPAQGQNNVPGGPWHERWASC